MAHNVKRKTENIVENLHSQPKSDKTDKNGITISDDIQRFQ